MAETRDKAVILGANGNSRAQIFAAVSICSFCICGGNLQGYTSSAIPSMRKGPGVNVMRLAAGPNLENLTESPVLWVEHGEFQSLSDTQVSWLSGLSPLGAFAGSILAPIPLKLFGPRGTILYLGGPIFLSAWLMIALAPAVNLVLMARFLGGLGIGVATSCAPVYIMDTAPVTLRGPLGTLPQCFFVVGILMSFILGSFLEWRETALTCATLTIPGIFFLMMTPESPKWLLEKRKYAQAQKSYFRLNGYTSSSLTDFLHLKNDTHKKGIKVVDLNQNQDEVSIKSDGEKTGGKTMEIIGITSIFEYYSKEPGALKASLVVFGLMAFQQFTGINGVNFYTVTIFNEALGQDAAISGHVSSIIVAGMLTGATFSSIYLIERLGRKVLLILSVTFIGLGAFSIGGFFYVKESMTSVDVEELAWLPLVSLVIFVVAFSVGYGPVCWIIGAEILDSRIRPIISPIAVGFNWFCVFAVAKTYPDLVSLLGTFGTFWLYGSLAIVGLVFTIVCVPETKGKSEEEIQSFFQSKKQLPMKL